MEKSRVLFSRIEQKTDGVRFFIGVRATTDLHEHWEVGYNHSMVIRYDPLAMSHINPDVITTGGMCLAKESPEFKALCGLYSECRFVSLTFKTTLGSPSYGNPDAYSLSDDLLTQDPFFIVAELRRNHFFYGDDVTVERMMTSPSSVIARARNAESYPSLTVRVKPETVAERSTWYRTGLDVDDQFEDVVSGIRYAFMPCLDLFLFNNQGRGEERTTIPLWLEEYAVVDFRGAKSVGAPV